MKYRITQSSVYTCTTFVLCCFHSFTSKKTSGCFLSVFSKGLPHFFGWKCTTTAHNKGPTSIYWALWDIRYRNVECITVCFHHILIISFRNRSPLEVYLFNTLVAFFALFATCAILQKIDGGMAFQNYHFDYLHDNHI